ncbi:MAG: DinB family protein [Chitinophagaceae bacterium]
METKTTPIKSIVPFIDLYDLHTKLFPNVIEGISEKDANNRLNTRANHPAWLTGSLVQQRYELANALDAGMQPTFHELFKDHKGIQDNTTYPPLHAFKKDWEEVTPVLREALLNMNDDQLDSVAPFDMGEEVTYYQGISFLIDRESYCIGQIGLWRRLLGYEAMKY